MRKTRRKVLEKWIKEGVKYIIEKSNEITKWDIVDYINTTPDHLLDEEVEVYNNYYIDVPGVEIWKIKK